METARLLSNDDFCSRYGYLAQRWEPEALRPSEILYRAVQHGLEFEDDVSDFAMQLCIERPIDTPETDLLGLAEHLAALADLLVWVVRPEGPWERAAGVKGWESSAFLHNGRLRQLWLVDSWSEEKEIAALSNWYLGGECAAFGLEMDLVIAIIGKHRDGRWSSPWTRGFQHPVAKDLRFLKRDGEPFGETWKRVWREEGEFSREEWLDSLTADGVLSEILLVREIEVPPHSARMMDLAVHKLAALKAKEVPAPQLGQCFGPRPCPFRFCCPQFRLPSGDLGFISLLALQPPPHGTPQRSPNALSAPQFR